MEKTAVFKTRLDHVETVAEELRLNGFNVNVVADTSGRSWLIHYETVAGTFKYNCAEQLVISDYFRFVNHLGGFLEKWGLNNKIQSYKLR